MIGRPFQASQPLPPSPSSSPQEGLHDGPPASIPIFTAQQIESAALEPLNMTNEAIGQPEIVGLVERLVITNLPKRLSERHMAKAIGVKPSDIHRAFMTVRGTPMYSALHALRLDFADQLLKENRSVSAETVAQRCGFGHYGVFHRNYRRRFGREPVADRPPSSQVEQRSFAADETTETET